MTSTAQYKALWKRKFYYNTGATKGVVCECSNKPSMFLELEQFKGILIKTRQCYYDSAYRKMHVVRDSPRSWVGQITVI